MIYDKNKLAATSYVWPADILTNIERLKDYVKGIQLVLFELPEESNLPNEIEVAKLNELKQRYELSYFIHLPLNLDIYNTDRFVKETGKFIEIGKSINAELYILHLNLAEKYSKYQYHSGLSNKELKKFYSAGKSSLDALFNKYQVKDTLLIENINYPIEWLDFFVFKCGMNICLDIGHLFLHNDEISLVKKYSEKIKLIHLHDLNEKGADHSELKNYKRISSAFDVLQEINYKKFIVLELFDTSKFFDSLDFLEKFRKSEITE